MPGRNHHHIIGKQANRIEKQMAIQKPNYLSLLYLIVNCGKIE
jgi:hypothetical protein